MGMALLRSEVWTAAKRGCDSLFSGPLGPRGMAARSSVVEALGQLWQVEALLGSGASAAVFHARCLGEPGVPLTALKEFLPQGSGLLALGDDVDYGFSNERAALEELRGHRNIAPHIEDLVMLPTPVLRLLNILSDASLQNEEEFEVDDIREECSKYGQIVSLFVPKESLGKGHVLRMMASKSAAMFVNLGMFILLNTVFVEYAYAGDSKAAQRALTGKRFNGKFVVATF